MKFNRQTRGKGDKANLTMTAMIDIVFLLLVFFVMTFKVLAPEGDFMIAMPAKAFGGVPQSPPDSLPLVVRLTAHPDGRLAQIALNQRRLASFKDLHLQLRELIGDEPGPDVRRQTELELACDEHLNYEYVIDAITAVSGYISPDRGRVVRLIDKIQFSPPKNGE